MFGIDAWELLFIIVLAVLLFGPEKMPEYSRKAARIFVYLRGIANNTQNTLREQLGPEYADLELTDLNPKTFIKKHLSQEVAAIEQAKREIEQMKSDLEKTKDEAEAEINKTKKAADDATKPTSSSTTSKPSTSSTKAKAEEPEKVYVAAPFDVEAT